MFERCLRTRIHKESVDCSRGDVRSCEEELNVVRGGANRVGSFTQRTVWEQGMQCLETHLDGSFTVVGHIRNTVCPNIYIQITFCVWSCAVLTCPLRTEDKRKISEGRGLEYDGYSGHVRWGHRCKPQRRQAGHGTPILIKIWFAPQIYQHFFLWSPQ